MVFTVSCFDVGAHFVSLTQAQASEAPAAMEYDEAVQLVELIMEELARQSVEPILAMYPERRREALETDSAKVILSMNPQYFTRLEDGGFKNAFQAGSGHSATARSILGQRSDIEERALHSERERPEGHLVRVLQLSKALAGFVFEAFRPKYAFYDPLGDYGARPANFGSLFVEFKSSVKKRITLSQADSMRGGSYIQTADVRASEETERRTGPSLRSLDYVEAQIWGPLALSDVATIFVDSESLRPEDSLTDWEVYGAELRELSDKYGFEIVSYKPRFGEFKPGETLYKPEPPSKVPARALSDSEQSEYAEVKRRLSLSELPTFKKFFGSRLSCSSLFE